MKKLDNFEIRSWKTKDGETHTAYYYRKPRDANGKRKAIPLGTDYKEAVKKWADIHHIKIEYKAGSLKALHTDYMKWANNLKVSKLAPVTIKNREQYWKSLEATFGDAPDDQIKPFHLLEYFEQRTSQDMAKREIKYISVLYNWGRARGKTNALNPCTGIMKQLKVDSGRNIYVTDEMYNAVYARGDQYVKDVMDFCYMTASRPTEALTTLRSQIHDEYILMKLPKTERKGNKVKRLPIEGDLKSFLKRRRQANPFSKYILSDVEGNKLTLTRGQLRTSFRQARDKANAEVSNFVWWSMMDLRAKAATDTALKHGMEEARKLLGHTTEKQTKDYVRPLIGEAGIALDLEHVAKVAGSDGQSDS